MAKKLKDKENRNVTKEEKRIKAEEVIEPSSFITDVSFSRYDLADFMIRDILKHQGIKDFKIESIEQIQTKYHSEAKDTIADIEFELADEPFLTVEIHLGNKSEISRNGVRCVLSSIETDSEYMKENHDFLPQQLIIIMSEEDILGNNRNYTSINYYDNETMRPINYGPTIVYVNGEVKDENYPDINYLMEQLLKTNYRDADNPTIRQVLYDLKENEKNRMFLHKEAQKIVDDLIFKETQAIAEENERYAQENEDLKQKYEQTLLELEHLKQELGLSDQEND